MKPHRQQPNGKIGRLTGMLFAICMGIVAAHEAGAQEMFTPVWQTTPWDSGGVYPSSVSWSMVQSGLDLDNDGKKEYLFTSSWSGIYYNGVYLLEENGNNSCQLVWSYSFYPYSNDYCAVTVADLNQNGRKEILCLVDPADSSYHGFYVFEWNGTDNGFPSLPTATWNLGLAKGFDEGTAIIAGDFDNDGREEVAVSLVQTWSPAKSRLMVFSLAAGSTFTNPTWNVEFTDTTTFAVLGYALAATDLDRNGKKELIACGWEQLHLAIYECTGSPNTYQRAANITGVSSAVDFSNMGFVEANFDNNGTNELYIMTANGTMYVMTNPGSVGLVTAANFTQLYQYNSLKGCAGMTAGDLDGNGVPELYVAGSYHEAVFRWKYSGGVVTNASSYQQGVVFQDDTTDSHTPSSDQGYFRPSKIAVGDFDRDGRPDMVIASASFAGDKPVILIAEQTATEVAEPTTPVGLELYPNYPNPFNPSTNITYSLDRQNDAVLAVYDPLGREVARLVDGTVSAGIHQVSWDAGGSASGVYFTRFTAGGRTKIRSMILVR